MDTLYSTTTLLRRIVSNILVFALNALLPIATIPFITDKLGFDGYGLLMILIASSGLYFVVGGFGLEMVVSKFVASKKIEHGKILTIFLVIRSVLFFILLPFYIFLIEKTIDGISDTYMLIIVMLSFFWLMRPNAYLSGLQDYSSQLKSEITGKAIYLVLLIVVYQNNLSVVWYLSAYCVGQVVITIYQWIDILIIKKVSLLKVGVREYENIIKEGLGYFSARILNNIIVRSSTYFVSLYLTLESVGIYAIVVQLYKAGQSLIGAISKVMYTANSSFHNIKLLLKVTLISFLFLILGFLIAFFFGEYILGFIFTDNVDLIYKYSLIVYFSLFSVLLSSLWGYPALVGLDKDHLAHIGILISGLVYFSAFYLSVFLGSATILSFIMCILYSDFSGAISRVFIYKKVVKESGRI
jgi:O-antigen/teichoic acid export membrane protein